MGYVFLCANRWIKRLIKQDTAEKKRADEGTSVCLCAEFSSVCVCVAVRLCVQGAEGGVQWGSVGGDLEPINSSVWTTGPNSAFLFCHKGFSLASPC